RKSKILAFLRLLITPLKRIHYDFSQKRNNQNGDLYRLKHNGQVCYLRKVLNDNFDKEQRRIKIIDGNQFKAKYIYTEGEQKPVYLGTMYLNRDVDYAETGVDFIVKIPLEVWKRQKTETNQIGELRFYAIEALIDYYKLAGKRYIIELL
ncbi:hypothetical protein, partial [Capnocytophaga sp.]|uniref:hypothetical protein n=1 Tax=Capnocytophaga sp. TaxID=44737 RepID=UPI0026DD7DE6